MNVEVSQHGGQRVSGAFRVDISRGQRIDRVSSEWFARPDDERYLNRRTSIRPCAAGQSAPRPARSKADPSALRLPETTPSGWP
jgi:hypothetical protein